MMNVLIQDLVNRLHANDPTLRELYLSRLPLFEVSANEISEIVKALQHNTQVTTMDLWIPAPAPAPADDDDDDDLQMEDAEEDEDHTEDYSFLSSTFSSNTSITSLKVSCVALSRAWCDLFDGLSYNPSIEVLELGDATSSSVSFVSSSTEENNNNNNNNNASSTSTELAVLDDAACYSLRDMLLSNSTKLQTLILRGFSISDRGIAALAQGLVAPNNPSLQSLELHQINAAQQEGQEEEEEEEEDDGDDEDLQQQPTEGLGHILRVLQGTNIKEFSVIDCDMYFEHVMEDTDHPFVKMLANNHSLRTLRIHNSNLDVDAIRPIAIGIVFNNNNTLKTLDLRHSELSRLSCEALADVLARQSCCGLKNIGLEDTGLNDNCMRELSKGLWQNQGLREINVRGNDFTGQGCSSLALSLRYHPSLESLDISENDIGNDTGAREGLGNFLECNRHIRSLNLEAASLTDEDIEYICRGLVHNPMLFRLNLSQNAIGKVGAQAIVNALTSSLSPVNRLQSLNLSACRIDDETVKILASGLKRNTTLRILTLVFNIFGNEGARALAEMLPGSHLEVLELQLNPFDNVGLKYLVNGLSKNYRMQHLYILDGSFFQTKGSNIKQQLFDYISHLLALNRSGRRVIQENNTISSSLWPSILKRADQTYGVDAIFYILQQGNICY